MASLAPQLLTVLCGLFAPDFADDTFKWLATSQIAIQYDAAGNIEFDGQYFYQYDAWNRLVQTNEATWNTGTSSVDIGLIVKHYTYDGHGRLIRIQSPYPDPWTAQTGDFRTERLYYDGIRRIQEVVVDPVTGESGGGEDSEGEESQIGGGQAVEYLEREYVWGPGDNGFDELLVQYNGQGDEFWAIMDAGGDLVALCDLGGTNSEARVVGQWTYDAYGAVLSADHLHAMAHPHLGHKGLFVDRLDVGIVTASSGPESPRLVPFAHTICHNRSRVYSPALGRFFQRDPNATAMTLLSMSSTGRGFAAISIAFSMDDLYGDGANLYEYLGSNTWNRFDPLGLYMGPTDTLMIGYDVARSASALISNYSFDMEMDADWASDWTADDDEHSRFAAWSLPDGMGPEWGENGNIPMAGLGSFAVKAGMSGARFASQAGRIVWEMHHLIPKFLGGLKGAAGSRYALPSRLHQRQLHDAIAQLTQRHFGRNPNWGRSRFMRMLEQVNFQTLQQFRRDFYSLLRRFDSQHGTALVFAESSGGSAV